ncbi:uncharacterized protein LOC113492482 isoform X2 [Trichoplusia ni]|uniref:Uncharacterized protein LOC113492482 isoform X2 n=1 Tax=Trichoplusia ni TaxID=7111 RepID=A0A7E5VBT5_TRINI|nr:uncharacterized protein LOC113492482 isoform X2 [Trichoplusia ni]
MLLELDWWVYLIIVLSLFAICLGLNYVLKKVNEAKLDGRFIRMRQKASATQSTQVQGPQIEMETARPLVIQNYSERLSTPPGISLVFNQEENLKCNRRMRDLEETYNIIKNSLSATKQEVQSLKMIHSHDTHGSSSLALNLSGIRKKEPTRKENISMGPSILDSKPNNSVGMSPGDKRMKELEETYNIIKSSLTATKQEVQSIINAPSLNTRGSSSLTLDFCSILNKESFRIKPTSSILPDTSTKDSKPNSSTEKSSEDSTGTQ